MPLDVVVEFKRGVYEMALTELARYLPRNDSRNRFLRGNGRPNRPAQEECEMRAPRRPMTSEMELPPGASFDPNPQAPSAS